MGNIETRPADAAGPSPGIDESPQKPTPSIGLQIAAFFVCCMAVGVASVAMWGAFQRMLHHDHVTGAEAIPKLEAELASRMPAEALQMIRDGIETFPLGEALLHCPDPTENAQGEGAVGGVSGVDQLEVKLDDGDFVNVPFRPASGSSIYARLQDVPGLSDRLYQRTKLRFRFKGTYNGSTSAVIRKPWSFTIEDTSNILLVQAADSDTVERMQRKFRLGYGEPAAESPPSLVVPVVLCVIGCVCVGFLLWIVNMPRGEGGATGCITLAGMLWVGLGMLLTLIAWVTT